MNSRSRFAVVASSSCLVFFLLLGTVLSKGAPADTPGTNVYRHLAVYTEVLSRIKSEYVEEPDMKSVTQAALHRHARSDRPVRQLFERPAI